MAGFYCLVWVGVFGFVCLCLVFSFCFFVNLYYQSKDLKCSWISVMFLFTASCPKWDIRPVAYAGIGLCEQQQKSCPERWMFLGEWMHTAPPLFSCAALDSPLQVTQQHCVIFVDFPAFPRLFSPGAGSSFGKQWPSHGPWPSEFMLSWFPVFPCVLLMCYADWNNPACVQANPQSPAVPQQHFQGGNPSLALPECTCPCLSWDAPAVHLSIQASVSSSSLTFNCTFALPIPRAAACPDGRAACALLVEAACIRELQKLPTSWAVKLCCFKVTLTWVLQQTCTASAAAVSHEGAAVKY